MARGLDADASELNDRYGTLDTLVNNVGVLPGATAQGAEVISASLFHETFDTNLFGAVNVIEQLLPLRRSLRPAAS